MQPGTPGLGRAAEVGENPDHTPPAIQELRTVTGMKKTTEKNLMMFSGRAHPGLAEEVVSLLGTELVPQSAYEFANSEIYIRYEESVRGCDAFVIQSHTAPINEWIMEHLIMVDALKRASAKRIVAVVPYYGYSRSDKKTLSREPIAGKLMAEMFKVAGVDRMISLDLHTGQIQGFFDGPFDHLTALPLLVQWIQANVPADNRVIVSPDAGRVSLTEKFATHLSSPIAILHKTRDPNKHNESESREVIGDVEGKTAIIIDDMIDTAGTICGSAKLLKERGAARVIAMASHAVFSGPAVERLEASVIEQVVVTNTLPITEERRFPGLVQLSIAPILASALRAVFEEESVSEIFRGENA